MLTADTGVECIVLCVTANKTSCVYPDQLCASTSSCISVHQLCDGKVDCPDLSDEGPLCGQFIVPSHTSLLYFFILVFLAFQSWLRLALTQFFSVCFPTLFEHFVHSSLSSAIILHTDHKLSKSQLIIFPFNFWLTSSDFTAT